MKKRYRNKRINKLSTAVHLYITYTRIEDNFNFVRVENNNLNFQIRMGYTSKRIINFMIVIILLPTLKSQNT